MNYPTSIFLKSTFVKIDLKPEARREGGRSKHTSLDWEATLTGKIKYLCVNPRQRRQQQSPFVSELLSSSAAQILFSTWNTRLLSLQGTGGERLVRSRHHSLIKHPKPLRGVSVWRYLWWSVCVFLIWSFLCPECVDSKLLVNVLGALVLLSLPLCVGVACQCGWCPMSHLFALHIMKQDDRATESVQFTQIIVWYEFLLFFKWSTKHKYLPHHRSDNTPWTNSLFSTCRSLVGGVGSLRRCSSPGLDASHSLALSPHTYTILCSVS